MNMNPDSLSQGTQGGHLPSAEEDLAGMRQSLANVRMLLQLTVIAMVVVVGGVNVFLFHQVRLLRRQASDMQTASLEMAKAIGEYTNAVPLMERFIADLQKFAERDAAFAQILSKYPLPSQKTTNVTAVSTNPPAQTTRTQPPKTTPTPKTGPTK